MNKEGRGKGKGGIVILFIIIIGLLVWGYIVGKQTANFSTCNLHFGIFCWKWSLGSIGQSAGTVGKLLNGS